MSGQFEQYNRLFELSTKPIEKLEDVLRNINRVLVGIQHAIVRVWYLGVINGGKGERSSRTVCVPNMIKTTKPTRQAYVRLFVSISRNIDNTHWLQQRYQGTRMNDRTP